jgi:hypothetical protein
MQNGTKCFSRLCKFGHCLVSGGPKITNQAWGQKHSGDMLELLSQSLNEFLFNWDS